MTRDTIVEELTALSQTIHTNKVKESEVERRYTSLLNAEREPYRKRRLHAESVIEKIREDPRYVQHFAVFKPGDFVKKGGEYYEVESTKLALYHDDAEPPTIGVRLNTWEIRWNGERGKYRMTLDQEDVEGVPETADKRLLKRVKKRIIQRLEGAG